MVDARDSGRGDGSSMGFHFGKRNKFNGICFTTMGTYLTFLNYTLKNDQDDSFHVMWLFLWWGDSLAAQMVMNLPAQFFLKKQGNVFYPLNYINGGGVNQ